MSTQQSRDLHISALQKRCASNQQLAVFHGLFNQKAPISESLCLKNAQAFEWDWFGFFLLSPTARAKYITEAKTIQTKTGLWTPEGRQKYNEETAALFARLFVKDKEYGFT